MLFRLTFLVFIFCFTPMVKAQVGDRVQAIYFNEGKGSEFIIKMAGEPIILNVGEYTKLRSDSLEILSDSTILIDDEIILLSSITSVTLPKTRRAILGGTLAAIGAAVTTGGALILNNANKAIDEDLALAIVYFPLLIFGGAGIVGGTIVTGVGLGVLLFSIPSPVKIIEPPVVKLVCIENH